MEGPLVPPSGHVNGGPPSGENGEQCPLVAKCERVPPSGKHATRVKGHRIKGHPRSGGAPLTV